MNKREDRFIVKPNLTVREIKNLPRIIKTQEKVKGLKGLYRYDQCEELKR